MPRIVQKKKKNQPASPKGCGAQLVRVKQLEAENAALRAHIQRVKVKVEAKFRELQQGVARRLESERGLSERGKVGIMDYLKQGFFTALGVIAAFAVVDMVEDELAEPDLASAEPEPDAGLPEPDFETPDLDLFGGVGKPRKAPKAPKASKASKAPKASKASKASKAPKVPKAPKASKV